jgi:hypothetical protein
MQSAGASPLSFSPAGNALAGSVSPNEDELARKKRLAAVAAARNNISGSLSPAGSFLFNLGT